MKKSVIAVFLSCVVLASILFGSAFSLAQAEVSWEFRKNLQKQYESGHIPDPAKSMSYEEKLAIRKKQQKLEEERRKQEQMRPMHPPPSVRQQRDDRIHRQDRPSERTYEYCRNRWRPGTYEFSECMRGNREMIWRDRDHRWDSDRYDNFNRYDRYDRYDSYDRRY